MGLFKSKAAELVEVGKPLGLPLSALEHEALRIPGDKLSKRTRKECPLGDKLIDFSVRIIGGIKVAGDSQATVKEGPKLMELLPHVLAAIPEQFRSYVVGEVADRFADYQDGGPMPEPEKFACVQAELILAAVQREKTQPRSGSVSGIFDVTLVERG